METEISSADARVWPDSSTALSQPVAEDLGPAICPAGRALSLRHYFATAAIVALCGLVSWISHALSLTEANVVMIFLAGVTFVAARFGRGPAIFAAMFGV